MEETSLIWKPNPKQEKFLSLPDSIFEAMYGGAAYGGKELKIDTPILTNLGFKNIGSFDGSEIIYDENGWFTSVTNVFPIKEDLPCYKMTFDTGEFFICSETHLWPVLNYQEREKNFKRTDDYREKRRLSRPSRALGLRPDLALMNSDRKYNYLDKIQPHAIQTQEIAKNLVFHDRANYSIDVCKPIFHPEQTLLIHPYVLGAWLGDGSRDSGRITGIDDFIFNKMRLLGYEISDHRNILSHNIKDIMWALRSYNVLNDKRIPEIYLFSSIEQRLELLRGMMDTDGYVDKEGCCELSLSKEDLSDDIYRIICSLGIKAFRSKGASFLNGRICADRYRITFTTNQLVASLPRKAERLTKSIDNFQKIRFIHKCEQVESVPVRCISVDSQSHCYLAGEHFIPTHNTEVLSYLPVIRGFINHPRFKAILFRRTFPELEHEVIPRVEGYFRATGGKYNGSTKCWTWPSGARYFFGHMEHEADVKKYDTAEFHYVAFDELTSFTEFQYLYLIGSRCRSSFADLPAIVRSGTNPGNIGNTWVKNRFQVDKVPSLTVIKDKVTTKLRVFVQALPTDNTRVPPEKLAEYMATMDLLPIQERRAKKYADWNAFEGQSFPEFRIAHIPEEPSNACHCIEPIKIPAYIPRILAIDWGYAALAYALWIAVFPNKRAFAYREYGVKKTAIAQWASEISYASQGERIVSVVIDPSATKNSGQPKTIFQQVAEYLSEDLAALLHCADNDRISGKALIHDYLRWTPKPKRTQVDLASYDEEYSLQLMRSQGMEEYHKYMASFKEEEPEDVQALPKLQIFDNLTLLKEVIPSCIPDDNRKEDIKAFDGDDPYDTLRYALKEVDSYVSNSKQAYEKERNVQEIEQKLEATGNFHEYFMKLRKMRATEMMVIPNHSRVHSLRVGR
jgi:hypothetical protein